MMNHIYNEPYMAVFFFLCTGAFRKLNSYSADPKRRRGTHLGGAMLPECRCTAHLSKRSAYSTLF